MELNDSELKRLIELAKGDNSKPITPILDTVYVLEKFLKSKRRNVKTLKRYQHIFSLFVQKYPKLPTHTIEIQEFLSEVKGSASNLATYWAAIRALYTFARRSFQYPDPFDDKSIPKPKIPHIEYKLRTLDELNSILATAKPGFEYALCCVLLDSCCRIGALGRHEVLPGQWYMGLHLSHLKESSFTTPFEKTGERTYTCKPWVIDMMRDIANEEGFIFHPHQAHKKNVSYSSHDLSKLFTDLVKRAGVKGQKLGPHSFRHLGGSVIAAKLKSVLAIKNKLGHDEIETSQIYINNFESAKSRDVSIIDLLELDLEHGSKHHPNQPTFLIEEHNTENPSSTELVPFIPTNTEIEIVEGEIDISEKLFPKIPDNLPRVHVYLTAKQLKILRIVSVNYTKSNPKNGIPGELSGMFKTWLRLSKL